MKTTRWIVPLSVALLSFPALAENSQTDSGGGYNLVYFLFICLVVIFIAYFTTRFIGRYAKGLGNSRGRLIKIAETVSLGPNRGLHLILVGKKLYLVGQADLGLSILTEVDDEELIAQAMQSPGENNSGMTVMGGFGQYLQSFMARDAQNPLTTLGPAEQLREHLNRIRRRKDRGE